MDWKLIFLLSLFGLGMAVATIAVLPNDLEMPVWLVVFVICAYIIARRRMSGHFLHGLLISFVNGIWVTAAHVLFFTTYIAHHPAQAAMEKQMPLPTHPRLMMCIVGPIFGLVLGLILGLFAWIAGKFVKPSASAVSGG